MNMQPIGGGQAGIDGEKRRGEAMREREGFRDKGRAGPSSHAHSLRTESEHIVLRREEESRRKGRYKVRPEPSTLHDIILGDNLRVGDILAARHFDHRPEVHAEVDQKYAIREKVHHIPAVGTLNPRITAAEHVPVRVFIALRRVHEADSNRYHHHVVYNQRRGHDRPVEIRSWASAVRKV